MWFGVPEGPCLIHSMNGDLLRTLEGPEGCVRPRLIQASTEGHCMVYYDKGHFCLFSVNGKLLGHHELEDSIKVGHGPRSLRPGKGLVVQALGVFFLSLSVFLHPSFFCH